MPNVERTRALLHEVYAPVAAHSTVGVPPRQMRALIDDLDIAAIVRPCTTPAEASRRLSDVVEALLRLLIRPQRIP